MKKFVLLGLILYTCFLNTISAQVPLASATLWEISGNGLSQPSYLFGTFHLLCPDDLVITDTIMQKFKASKKLYLEVDLSDPNMGMKMMQNLQMRDTTLHDLYDSLTYQQVSDSLEKIAHIKLEMFNKTKPFGLFSVVMMGVLDCPPASWELQLIALAKKDSMTIAGLETLESQLAIFDTIPYQLQAEQLKEMVFNLDSTKRETSNMINLYKEKNINEMNERATSDPLMRNYLDLILYNRNTNWIPTIERNMKVQTTFFAFGAGHLASDKGMINLLRKRGYIVKPMN